MCMQVNNDSYFPTSVNINLICVLVARMQIENAMRLMFVWLEYKQLLMDW